MKYIFHPALFGAAITGVALATLVAVTTPALPTTPEEVDRLNFAIADNDLELVREILESGINVNTWNEVGLTPLVYAVETFPDEEVLDLLFEHGANVNIQMPRNGKTALMKAAGNPESYVLVPRLLDEGADVNLADKQGYTALWAAVDLFFFSDEIDPELALRNVLLILEAGADPDHEASGMTPLHLAAREGYADVVRVLLEHNATADALTVENLTALELAQAMEHQDVAEFLMAWEGNATESEVPIAEPAQSPTPPGDPPPAPIEETAEPVG